MPSSVTENDFKVIHNDVKPFVMKQQQQQKNR